MFILPKYVGLISAVSDVGYVKTNKNASSFSLDGKCARPMSPGRKHGILNPRKSTRDGAACLPVFYGREEVVIMTLYESLDLLIAAIGTLIALASMMIALLTFLRNRKKK